MKAKLICSFSVFWMALTTLIVFIPNISPWIATPIVLIGTILVLGMLWAINLNVNSDQTSEFILYSIGLGLGYLLIGGLAINWVLPYLGVLQPLARLPLMVFFDLSALVLSACVYYFHSDYVLPWKPQWPNKTSLFFGIVPLVFVIMSVCGAELLNNGGTGILTLVMLFAIALYVLVLIICRRRVDGWVYVSALYFISLSLLLMYSLRSSHIFGWDINLEYQVFQMTLQNLRWKMSYYPALDYNACLSVTILPTIFKELTNIPSEYVFKVTFQLLFAIVPIMVYALAKRYLEEALALLAAFLLISQTWFFEQLPALIRQETAFIFYIVMVLVLFDKKLTARTRYILFYLFTAGLILSHYSTAYVWIGLLLGTLLLSYICRFFIRSLREQPIVIKPMMLVISLLFIFIWQALLTHTAGQATNFFTNNNGGVIATSTTNVIKNNNSAVSASNGTSHNIVIAIAAPVALPLIAIKSVVQNAVEASFFASPNPNTDQNVLSAEQGVVTQYGKQTTSDYVPTAINENISVPPKLPSFLSFVINLLARISKVLFIDIFPIIGIIAAYLALRRRQSSGTYDFIILNIGAYVLIVLMLLVPYLQEYYNFTRLYLQMFLSLSTLAIVGGAMVVEYLPRYRVFTLAVVLTVIFCSLNGSFDQLTGGSARATLNQSPSTLDEPYIYDTEVAGAQWLAANRNPAVPVQADVVANLRLESFGNMSADNFAIFPETLQRAGYVYLINTNIMKGEAFYGYQNNLLIYNYPLAFLNANKDLIYNDGGSRIYQ
jgi:uncharacterized membrane protein